MSTISTKSEHLIFHKKRSGSFREIVMTCILCLLGISSFAQDLTTFVPDKQSLLYEFSSGDSVVYYQCHIDSVKQQLTTASGQTLNSQTKRVTITEKFVLYKIKESYVLKNYSSPLTVLPNRRFSGLKFGEKPYWDFSLEGSAELDQKQLKILQAIELKGKEANEYDYPITKYNSNQLIILHGKKVKQLGLLDGILLSKLSSGAVSKP